ncbi:MAG: sugar ABC transporter ATP-binding protein [Microbacteriaceae bacterium]
MAETLEQSKSQTFVLEAIDISKKYGGVQALDNVSLRLKAGEVHSLAGENGCGKSTLIKIISGVEKMDAGTIVVNGVSHNHMTPRQAIQLGIQVIFQDFSLFPNLTVLENIMLTDNIAQKKKFFSKAKIRPVAEKIIHDLGLDLDLDSYVEELTVAEKQLTAICRALVNDARVIFMDEPTTALTHTEVERLFELVERLRGQGVSIVFVSHKLDEALGISQEVTVLRSGKLVIDGPASDFDYHSLSTYMTGKDISNTRKLNPVDEQAAPILEVEKLSRDETFEDINFALYPGEVLGITGLLGSGRSEIAESLFGVSPAHSGTITVNGVQHKIKNIDAAIRAGIGYVPEDRLTQGLFLDQPIADNIIAGSLGAHKVAGLFLNDKKIKRTINQLFRKLRIKAPNVDAPVRSLSGGNAQRVVLAKWLANKPKVLILNGPTVGVDVGSKEEILTILRELASQKVGVIIVSDDAPELVAVCNRVLIVKQGRLFTTLAGDEVNVNAIQEGMAV